MKDIKEFEALVDRWVAVQNLSGREPIALKIELLALMLQKLKHARRQKREHVTFEEFEQCHLFADAHRLVVTAPDEFVKLGAGTEPIRLQAPLLLFLLIYHRERYEVLKIIDLFIERIWDDLESLDFKKTKTGVTRCYTNTRFAAHTLRDYGLLKFTHREAFKTWELSLAGLLVAANLLGDKERETKGTWTIPIHQKVANFDLLPEIRQAWDRIQSYDDFVRRLAEICKPNASVFKTFAPALQRAFAFCPSIGRL